MCIIKLLFHTPIDTVQYIFYIEAMRIILYSGKGGVGKTSLAATNAAKLADAGHRVLVVSADPAHSLGDVLGVPLGPDESEIAPRLFAKEFGTRHALDHAWQHIGHYIEHFLQSQGLDPLAAAEISALPGIGDLLVLIDICEQVHHYDVVILDCAPTGATTALLSIPDAVNWYMQRFFPAERALIKMIKPVAEKLISVPLPADDVFGQIEHLHGRLVQASELLTNPDITTLRLVSTADDVVLAETRRALSKFRLFGLHVDAVLLNRLYPLSLKNDPTMGQWVTKQRANIVNFPLEAHPTPTVLIEHTAQETIGNSALLSLANQYPDTFATVPPLSAPVSVEVTFADGNPDEASWRIPILKQSNFRLWVDGSELVFVDQTSSLRYAIPESLIGWQLQQANWSQTGLDTIFVRQ